GLKVQRAAEAAGRTPAEQADATAPRFAEAWRTLDVAPDRFVRTTQPAHRAAVTEFLTRVHDSGYVDLGRYQGRYCVSCEAYADGELCPVHKRPLEHVEE